MTESQGLGAIIVGTGFGVVTHVRAMRAAGFDVLALVGRNPAKTADRASLAGIPRALTQLEEALSLPGVDVVAVATPPLAHADISLRAIAAGKHVVCEKPFAMDTQQARQMLEAAERQGVIHYIGTEHRWDTGQALTRQAVKDGTIGRALMATMILHVPMLHSADAEVPEWWGDAAQGGGWLGAYGSHQIDFLQDLFGDFVGVSASLSVVSEHDWTADDSFSLHFRTASGLTGIMQSSCASLGPPLVQFRVTGSAGSLDMAGDRVFVSDSNGRRELPVPDGLSNHAAVPPDNALMNTAYDKLHAVGSDLSPYTKLYQTLRADILREAMPYSVEPATFKDGVSMQRVLDAVRESARRGVWVDLTE